MKKLIIGAAIVCMAIVSQAATVGWTVTTGNTAFANDAYALFMIGQNGVASVATVTAILDAGSDYSSYVFGSGTIGTNGSGIVLPGNSGKTLDAGTYTAFAILFDSATPKAGESKYVVIDGASTLTKTITGTTANISFTTGNAGGITGDVNNWKTYGAPEPTSGVLLLLGVAGLALKRRRA